MREIIMMSVALGLVACAAAPDSPVLVETPERTGVVMPIESPSMDERSRLAVQDLAARLSIPVEQIRLVSQRAVEWPSSALGCPQPDRMYLTVLTPGHHLVLAAGGVTYHYHAGEQGAPFRCPEGRREAPAAISD